MLLRQAWAAIPQQRRVNVVAAAAHTHGIPEIERQMLRQALTDWSFNVEPLSHLAIVPNFLAGCLADGRIEDMLSHM